MVAPDFGRPGFRLVCLAVALPTGFFTDKGSASGYFAEGILGPQRRKRNLPDYYITT